MNNEKGFTIYYDGRCKCCLNNLGSKSMWQEYYNNNEREVYGEMLMECFSVTWDVKGDEYICEPCISRLRDAVNLKIEILAVQELLSESILIENGSEQYVDINKESVVQEIEENLLQEVYEDNLEDMMDIDSTLYLQDDVNEDSDSQTCKEFPIKKKRRKPLKSYKLYTTEEMQRAKEAVMVHGMTQAEAARMYRVPRKTLCLKIAEDGMADLKEEDILQEKQLKFINEIRTILTYTNAIPFKTKTNKYFCAYCPFDKPPYDDSILLSQHTKTDHADGMIREVEHIMRPPGCNEILKMNIENLKCTVCNIKIEDWNSMFIHFAQVHNVEFDEVYSRLIPYSLTSDLMCVLCNERFSHFRHLDSHMNAHFCNYICYECGDPFLSSARLDVHLRIHKIGKYPCELCNKIFALDQYRARHIAVVHKNIVKCLYCPEKFVGSRKRHQHMVEHHPNQIRMMTCEVCGKGFTWKAHLYSHKRKSHPSR